MKRKRYKEVDGEMITYDEALFAWCSCTSDSGYDLVKVPTVTDPEGTNLCGLCGSNVWWGTAEEISNNARR